MYSHQPSISIIVPIYNTEAFLDRCLTSLTSQTFSSFEVLCIDDQSDDRSAEIIDLFVNRDSRFKKFSHKRNQGAGVARNTGLQNAQGHYIAFLDSDDTLEIEALEKIFNHAEQAQADICCFPLSLDFPSEKKKVAFEHTLNLSLLPDGFTEPFSCTIAKNAAFMFACPSVCTKLFRHSFLERIGARFTEHRIAEDLLFSYSAFAQTDRIAVLPNYFYNYNQEKDTSISKEAGDIVSLLKTLELLNDKLTNLGLMRQFEEAFANLFLYHVGGTLTIMKNGSSLNESFQLLEPWRDWLKSCEIQFLYPQYEEDHRYICLGDPLEYATNLFHKRQDLIKNYEALTQDQNILINDLRYQLQQGRIYTEEFAERLSSLEKDYADVVNSRSFRIGKTLLWAPMVIKSKIKKP